MMRTWIACSQCVEETAGAEGRVDVELNDRLLFEQLCPRGHKLLHILETTKFSLLFDFGIAAYLDGYYREAVSSFAAALERFYEFCIRVLCRKNGIPFEAVEAAWKAISSHSERQLGVFCLLYLQETKSSATLLPSTCVEFRNKVIHKGYLPTEQETLAYAEAVYDNMLYYITYLEDHLKIYSDEVWIDERARRDDMRRELHTTSHGHANFIHRYSGHPRYRRTFREKLLEAASRDSPETRWIFT